MIHAPISGMFSIDDTLVYMVLLNFQTDYARMYAVLSMFPSNTDRIRFETYDKHSITMYENKRTHDQLTLFEAMFHNLIRCQIMFR